MAITVIPNPARITWRMFREVDSIPGTNEHAQISSVTSGLERFRPVRTPNGRFRVPALTIRLGVDAQNTQVLRTATKSDELLAHEQGHFDLLFLVARALARELESLEAVSVDELAAELHRARDTHDQRADEIDAAYDRDTDHSRNREGQKKWDDAILLVKRDSRATKIIEMPL